MNVCLDDQVALVTSAARGIGQDIPVTLAVNGSRMVYATEARTSSTLHCFAWEIEPPVLPTHLEPRSRRWSPEFRLEIARNAEAHPLDRIPPCRRSGRRYPPPP